MDNPRPIKSKFHFFIKYKIPTIVFVLIMIGGGYYFYQKQTSADIATRYVLAAVEKGMILTSISGSGQVSSSNQVEIKPKVSGGILELNTKIGQEVKAGDILARLDTKDAQKTVRDAQVSLQSAQLSLDKLKRGSRPEEITSSINKVDDSRRAVVDAQTDLANIQNKTAINLGNAYEDAQNVVVDSYSKADDLLNRQLDKIFIGANTNSPKLVFFTSNSQLENDSIWQFTIARNDALPKLKILSLISKSNQAAIDQALIESKEQLIVIQDFLNKLGGAVNSAVLYVDFTQSELDSFKSTLNSARNTIASQINSLTTQQQSLINLKLANKDSIDAAQAKIVSAQDSLKQAEDDLALTRAGNDPLDIKAQEISVRQRQNSLFDAREKLADYVIVAPFDGIIASVGAIAKGDVVSSADIIATIITKQRLAEISLNEVDAARAKIGQKVTLTFDAVENLSLSGSVAEIDSIGTVSQGVVTYQVKIVFDTQEDAVKPGMSVSATIITNMKSDVLLVSNASLKSQNGSYYVELPNEDVSTTVDSNPGIELKGGVKQQSVVVGLVNDTMTEIVSGLNEGDLIVDKTITGAAKAATATSAASSQKSLFQMGGGGPRN